MVTICTASLTFKNCTFCPHAVFMCFVWIWKETAIISVYNTNWLVCITEMEHVYCSVRTGSSYLFQVYLDPRSVHVRYVVDNVALCHVFPFVTITLPSLYKSLQSELQTYLSWKTSIKQTCFWNSGALPSLRCLLSYRLSVHVRLSNAS